MAGWLEQHGGPEVFRVTESPDPATGSGGALIDVRAYGLDHPDVRVRLVVKRPSPSPLVPGSDPAGAVIGHLESQEQIGRAVIRTGN